MMEEREERHESAFVRSELAGAEAEEGWRIAAQIFLERHPAEREFIELEIPFFRSPEWTVVALVNDHWGLANPTEGPGPEARCYERDELSPLLDLARQRGSERLYLCDSTLPEVSPLFSCEPTLEALSQTIKLAQKNAGHTFGYLTAFLFDNTGQWGIYVQEEEIAFVGGEAELMRRYVARVGGVEVLQERLERLYSESPVSDDRSQRRFNSGKNIAPVMREYAYLRWPWPFPKPPLTVPERTGQAET